MGLSYLDMLWVTQVLGTRPVAILWVTQMLTKHEMVDLMGGRFDLARNGLRGHGCGNVVWVVDLRSAQTTAFRRRRSCWVEVDLVPGAPRWCGERYAAGAWSGSFRCLVAEALDAVVVVLVLGTEGMGWQRCGCVQGSP